MIVKICGLNPVRDVQLCIDLKVNYLGFVFYEKSPRNISLSDIKILSNYDKKNSIFEIFSSMIHILIDEIISLIFHINNVIIFVRLSFIDLESKV